MPGERFPFEQFLLNPDNGDLTNDTSFLESGIVDSTGILELIAFLEANPYTVNTARQIALRVGRESDQVQKELDLLEERRFVQKISYPGADVYRYIPPRRR